jgi:DNA-binding NarL/FixJ family response regulator
MEKLGKYLSSLTKPELEELKELLNLTDEEELVFKELARGRSRVSVSDKCMVSCSTVSNRVKAIQNKISRLRGRM